MSHSQRILCVGIVSDPPTGQSLATNATVAAITDFAGEDRCLHVRRSVSGWRSRFRSVVTCAWCIWTINRGDVIYLSLSSGKGLYFDAALTLLARWRGARRVLVHHHSYGPINAAMIAMRVLVRAIADRGTHVFLCEKMARQFFEMYRPPLGQKSITVSNRFLLARNEDHEVVPEGFEYEEGDPIRFGFIGNDIPAKGLDRAIDYVATHRSGDEVELVVAGVDSRPGVQSEAVRLLGHLSGEAKVRFFQYIDCLLLPSRYANEADPLVVIEAARYGAPSVVERRGCLEQTLPDDGLLVDRWEESYTLIDQFVERLDRSGQARRERALTFRRNSRDYGGELVECLVGLGLRRRDAEFRNSGS